MDAVPQAEEFLKELSDMQAVEKQIKTAMTALAKELPHLVVQQVNFGRLSAVNQALQAAKVAAELDEPGLHDALITEALQLMELA
jgi:hypothetical protein